MSVVEASSQEDSMGDTVGEGNGEELEISRKPVWLKHKSGRRGDFPGGPVVKTLRSQCRGPGIDPWLGN